MIYLTVTFIFLVGLALGSFLNVVIFRYNTGRGVRGRSGCMSCGKILEWYELIPIVSFIVQKRRCRNCKSALSWQYPLVELLTACLVLGTLLPYLSEPLTVSVFISSLIMILAWCILVVILVYDAKHKIIPDGLAYSFAALGFLRILLFVPATPSSVFYLTVLAGPILFLPFFLLWLVSKGRWIGLGDAKLALGIGWMLGFSYGLSAIVLAFWIGAVVSILLMVINRLNSNRKSLTMKSEIPFAPYLILGFSLVYFLGLDVMGLHTIFNL